MSAAELLARIIADAEARAGQIRSEGKRAAAEAAAKAEAEAGKVRAEAAARAKRETEAILERARSRGRLERRKAELAARWQVIDRVLVRAEEQVRQDPRYERRLAELVEKHWRPGAVVGLAKPDIEKLGRQGEPAVEPADIRGGFTMSAGREKNDCSLEEVLRQVREEQVAELARRLFTAETADG